MQNCLAMKRVWLFLGVFSAVSILVGAPLMALCALKLRYTLLAILTLFVGHGIWGSPFYFIAYSRDRKTLAILPDVIDGLRSGGGVSYAALGEKHGMTVAGIRQLTERALKRGYIRIVTCEK